jgi:hypothetical protein
MNGGLDLCACKTLKGNFGYHKIVALGQKWKGKRKDEKPEWHISAVISCGDV